MSLRRALTFVGVALGTCAGALWWLYDGDADAALRPVASAGAEVAEGVGLAE